MRRFDNVLFDMDGTLLDSGPGITKSVRQALASVGIAEDNVKNLERFTGPPLSTSFREFYGLQGEQILRAVTSFRARYETVGIFESALYPGIEETLRACKEAGVRLAVASSKPEVFVKQILEHFQIAQYFDVAAGSALEREMSGKVVPSDKEEIVRTALAGLWEAGQSGATLAGLGETGQSDAALAGLGEAGQSDAALRHFGERTAMVGDRKFDVDGARANGVHPVGVAFGYGSREELTAAGAEFIADDEASLTRYLLGMEME